MLRAWLDDQVPQALFVDGEHGIGKTALLRWTLARARSRGRVVLSCAASKTEAAIPFAALDHLLADVRDADLATLPSGLRRALQSALLRIDSDDGAIDVRAVSLGFLELVRRLTRRGPVVFAVDDTQWLDLATARMLELVFRRLGGVSAQVLATYDRGAAGIERAPVLPADGVGGRIRPLRLEPLEDDDVARLLRRHGTEGWPRRLLRDVVRAAGGNPGVALELRRSVVVPRHASTWSAPLPVPESVGGPIRARIAALSNAARLVILAASSLADPTVQALEEAFGLVALNGLDETARSGLADIVDGRVRFVRPVVSAVAYGDASAGERRQVHARLADVVTDHGERLRHLALAAPGADDALAQRLERESDRNAAHGDGDRASEAADMALALTATGRLDDLTHRSLVAAERHLLAGDDELARDTLRQVVDATGAGVGRARALRRLAHAELVVEGVANAAASLARSAREGAADVALVAASAREGCALRWLSGDPGTLVEEGRRLVTGREGEHPLLAPLMAAAEFAVGIGDWPGDGALDALARVPPTDPVVAWIWACPLVSTVLWADDLEPLRLALGARGRPPGTAAAWLAWEAELEMWQERWTDAVDLAERGLELSLETGERIGQSRLCYVTGLIAAHRGDADRARAMALQGAEAGRRARLPTMVVLNRAVLGCVDLLDGSAAASLDHFEDLLSAPLPGTEPGVARLLPYAVEALVGAGRIDRAAEQLARLDVCRARLRAQWLLAGREYCDGLIQAAQGGLGRAQSSFERAVAAAGRPDRKLELGRHQFAAGMVLRRLRRRTRAVAALDAACRAFAEIGAKAWLDRAQAQLAGWGASPGSPSEALTPTQRRVAALVARGLSNKEVAAALSISVYTVEGTLKNVFQRLGIHSRVMLASRLGPTSVDADPRRRIGP